jgi:hypothetical protein
MEGFWPDDNYRIIAELFYLSLSIKDKHGPGVGVGLPGPDRLINGRAEMEADFSICPAF